MAIDKFRFGVGNDNGLLSSVWIAFANRNDVYIGLRSMAQSLKLSIHGNEGSRVCQIALTNKYWEEMGALATPPMANRSLQRWKRADPPKSGATEIVTIWFPRDHQRQRTEQPPKKRGFFLLEPAPQGMAVRVTFFESMEDPMTLEAKLRRNGIPAGYFKLEDGRNVFIAMRHQRFDEASLTRIRSGTGTGTTFDLSQAPVVGETKSNLSMFATTEARDGQPLHICELHGINLKRVA